MAANIDILSKTMLSAMRKEMKKISSEAKEMPFQEIYTKAVSKGVIETLKKLKSKGAGKGTLIGRKGKGIKMKPMPMIEKAKKTFMDSTGGSSGPAMEPIIKSIIESIVNHFAKYVEIQSTSGNGGNPPPPVGGTAKVIYNLIIKSMPPDLSKSMASCKTKGGLTKAISEGLALGLTTGVPGTIPFSPPSSGSPGPIVAIYK